MENTTFLKVNASAYNKGIHRLVQFFWGKDKTSLIETVLMEFSAKTHEIRGKHAQYPFIERFTKLH